MASKFLTKNILRCVWSEANWEKSQRKVFAFIRMLEQPWSLVEAHKLAQEIVSMRIKEEEVRGSWNKVKGDFENDAPNS